MTFPTTKPYISPLALSNAGRRKGKGDNIAVIVGLSPWVNPKHAGSLVGCIDQKIANCRRIDTARLQEDYYLRY